MIKDRIILQYCDGTTLDHQIRKTCLLSFFFDEYSSYSSVTPHQRVRGGFKGFSFFHSDGNTAESISRVKIQRSLTLGN